MSKKCSSTPALAIEFKASRGRGLWLGLLALITGLACFYSTVLWQPASLVFLPTACLLRALWQDPLAGRRLSWRAGQWRFGYPGEELPLILLAPASCVGRIIVLRYRAGPGGRPARLIIHGDACSDGEQRQLRRLLRVQG